jgi:hypothetical protein
MDSSGGSGMPASELGSMQVAIGERLAAACTACRTTVESARANSPTNVSSSMRRSSRQKLALSSVAASQCSSTFAFMHACVAA